MTTIADGVTKRDARPLPELSLNGGPPESLPQRLTAHLEGLEQNLSFPYIRPRDAATLIVIDRSGAVPKVLLGRRHTRHKFMPDKFVFPGGSVELNDRRIDAVRELEPRATGRLMRYTLRPSTAKVRGFALAAVRETFEETGLMVGKPGTSAWSAPAAEPWSGFAAAGVAPDLGALHFIARAITPPRRPRRFDARFFAVDSAAIAAEVKNMVGVDKELVELVWLALSDAERLDIPPITKTVLAELDYRIKQGFTPDLPVPFYRWMYGRFERLVLD